MLYTCLHHPNIFNIDFNNVQDNLSYYSHIMSILRHVQENGLLLSDIQGDLFKYINQNIDKWPTDSRIMAKKLLKNINHRNRIINVNDSIGNVKQDECKVDCCHSFENILNTQKDILVILDSCNSCIETDNGELVELSKYHLSNFVEKKRRISYVIQRESRTPSEFGNLIFKPIFSYCKSIKIIDRVIGSHIKMPHPGDLCDNYKSGLDFLFNCIANTGNSNVLAELYTSVQLPKPVHLLNATEKADIRQTLYNIEGYIDMLNNKYGLKFSCLFREDRTEFNHDRYIITDQIGLYIGRGFDLLDSHKNVNDNTIGLLEYYNTIESSIRALRDLKAAI